MYILLAVISMLLLSMYELFYKKAANMGMKSENIFVNTFLFSGLFKVIMALTFGVEIDFAKFLFYIPNVVCDLLASYLYIKSLKRVPIGVASSMYLIYYPLTMIISVLFLKESITPIKLGAICVIGVVVAILSAITTSVNREHTENIPKGFSSHMKSINKGIIFAITAGIFNCFYMILDKNCLNNGYLPAEMILYNGVVSVLGSIVYLCVYKKHNKDYKYSLTGLLLFAIFIRFLSSVIYTNVLKNLNASIVIPIIASDSIFVAIFSRLFFKEKLKKYQIAAIVVIVVCVTILAF